MPSWYFFVFLRFLAVFLVCRGRMDIVRVMGIVATLEIPYFFAWRLGVIQMYYDDPENFGEMIAEIGALLFQAGVLHASILYAISYLKYFCVPDAPYLLLRRVLVTIPLFIAVHFVQNQFAYSAFSSSRPG